jgi:hypothetical protein
MGGFLLGTAEWAALPHLKRKRDCLLANLSFPGGTNVMYSSWLEPPNNLYFKPMKL